MNFVRKLSFLLAGIMTATAISSCAIPDTSYSVTASAGAEKYVTMLEERLTEMPDSLVIASGDDAESYGVDTAGFVDDEGYTIRAVDGEVIILGKTDAALDRAVRHFSNYGNNDKYSFTYGEGYRVKNLTVNGNDISEYAIVRPNDADECMLYAANELAKYIKLACGVALPEYSESEYAAVSDKPARTISLKIDYPTLGDEAFTINVKNDGNIDILGGRFRGGLYGVYGFLQDMGWRFLADGYEYVYEAESVDLTDENNRTEEPAVANRFASAYPIYYDYSYGAHVNFHGRYLDHATTSKYGFYGIIAEACHGLDQNQVDWQGTYDGYKVEGKQPCFTNEDVLQAIEDHFRNHIEARLAAGQTPGKELCYIDVAQFDSSEFCKCGDCMEVLAEEGATSGAVLRMTNRMADMAAEYSPDIYALMLAYAGTNKPPRVTVPRDNVKISYCFYVGGGHILCSNHHISGEECPANTANPIFAEEFNGWTKICKAENMQVWYYPFNCYEIAFQSPCFDTAFGDMKYLIESNVNCVMFCEGENNDSILLTALSRLIWNGDMTEEEYRDMVEEYFTIFYGDAGKYIYEYTMMLQTAGDLNGCWCSFHTRARGKVSHSYISTNFDYMVGLFDQALKYAETEEVYNKIEVLKARMLYIGIAITHEERYLSGTDEERDVISERYTEMHRLFLEYNIPVFDDYINKCWAPAELDLEQNPSDHWCIY
ncbi:MAG: DUF4838 domain-containing protein [Clostridia bacterium]|nr:DUF4838 domain-containing protein [Clostridia bacterium]